jgi:single-strand DNA-binding protein
MNESFVTVVGNVVSDPISRPTKVGRPFASLRIASTTRRWDAEKRAFVDGSTNFLNVVAFNALAANVMTSVKKGHPVVVYGRLRVNQWETEKGEPRTSAEIDAFTIGHDLTRGQVAFTRLTRTQLDANDRLADPAIQDALHGEPGEPGEAGEAGDDNGRGPDEPGDEGVVVAGGFGSSGSGSSGSGSTGFGRRIEDADTDEYVVVNGS